MLKTLASKINTKWRDVIDEFINKYPEKWNALETKYQNDRVDFEGILEIFPKPENIFRCFNYFNPDETRVVILGQDPYHGAGQATGLCFAVPNGMKHPPSLRNIIREYNEEHVELSKTIDNSDLEMWAKQGVLMLNAALTVREKSPAAHMRYWKDFTQFIIDYTVENTESVIFVAWGAFAHQKMEKVASPLGKTKNHSLVVSSHPSPLSCYKPYKGFSSFVGSKPFGKIDKLLLDKNKPVAMKKYWSQGRIHWVYKFD